MEKIFFFLSTLVDTFLLSFPIISYPILSYPIGTHRIIRIRWLRLHPIASARIRLHILPPFFCVLFILFAARVILLRIIFNLGFKELKSKL